MITQFLTNVILLGIIFAFAYYYDTNKNLKKQVDKGVKPLRNKIIGKNKA
tara:strand:- start:1333 stop:1482 length:150 start_codon:yes stop_codon:yes gene_type:complete